MKKRLLQKQRGIVLALLCFLCVTSIKAQTWTAPVLTGSTPESGATYYMYNVGSNGYLTRGAWWGSQATVSAQPRLSASTSVVKWTATNSGDSVWAFQYNLASSDVSGNFLFSANDTNGDVFTDNSTNDTWNVVQTDAINNIYSIQVVSYGYVESQYFGTSSTAEWTVKGMANNAKYNRAGGDSYTQWKFVSQADLDLYNARVLLDKYMTYAKNKAIDVSSYIATYDAGVTADINTAAATLLTALGRTDVTSSITNPSFETNDFTGWTNNGGFATQGNDPGQGWTRDGANYVEKYTSAGDWWPNTLGAGSITQTVSGLSSGLYELVVSGHAVQQVGSNPLHTGAYITAGTQTTEVSAGQDYTISNIPVAGSTLTIGYALSGAIACNWTGFDNFRLYYYGPAVLPATQAELDALQVQITAVTALLASTTEGTAIGEYPTANRTVLSDAIASATTVYNNAIQAYVNSATSSLAASIATYSNSMNVDTNLLANGDYFFKIGGMYVNDPGSSSIADGTSPKISNNGLQSQINIANGSQIYTIAKVSGSDRILAIDRYSFFNAATSRNLNESALYKDLWGGTGDDPWRTQNIYYNGTNYAIQSGGNAANNGMWYLRTENELATNGINRTPIPADYVFELVPVSTVFSQQVAAGRTAFNAATIGVAVGEYNAARYNAFQSALVTAEGITAGTATKENLYAYSAALQLFVANANLINVIESSIAAMATTVGSTDSTTITVSAKGLSGAITLALSGTDSTLFSVSSDSLPLTADSVASTVVTIKYSPTVVSLSHVATLTISSIGAADKVFALTGSSYIQADTWTAPALTGSAPASGTTYYMYNVGSNGYLTRGAWYGTCANVSAQPRLNASTSVIKWTATNTADSIWSFQYNLDGADLADWFLCYTSTSGGDVFVDAWDVELRRPNRPWTVAVTDEPNKIYSIQVRSDYGGYNATQFLGSSTGTEDTNQGTCNVVRSNRDASDYTKWKFVSQDDLDLYNARVLLDKYMTYAKNKAMDASAYIATYNAGVTADINTAAATLLTALGRTDVTASITNPSFETAELAGWTNDGSFGNLSDIPTRGWTKDSTNYCGKSTTDWDVAPGSITQTVSGLSSGLYELVVSGYAVQNNGGNPLRLGAYITAGSQSTRVAAGQDYSISNIIVTGSTLTIGYSLVAPVKCNWTGFDNFRLYYYGPAVAIIPSKTQFSFNGGDEYVSDSLTVSGANLSDVISITAPAGITVNPTSLPAGSDNAKVVVTFENSTTVSGNITFTSGTTTVNVAVTAAPGEVCYTPLYPTGNLITDSRCNFYLANGWGGKSINTDPAYVYCGSSSAYINGGSIDRALNGTNGNAQMLASTAYRIKAKVWKVSGDNVGIGVWGWSNGQPDIYHAVTTTGSWQDVDFTFTSGATLGGNQGIFFNSGVGYIDNWEMYQISPVINVVESSIAAMATTVGSTDSTTITVSGNGLSGAITLALSGADSTLFSVSSASLPLTAADSVVSTVVTIKYSPTVVSLSHVATLTISSIGATDKVFALTGSSSAVSIEENATTSWNALVVNGRLKVIGVDSYDVYSVQGLKVAQVTANSSSITVALNQGVYVVKTDKGVQKVIVK